MKKILHIATGGTIASTNEHGALSPSVEGEKLLSLIPCLKDICTIHSTTIMSYDSTNIQPEQWVIMAETIDKNLDDYDGFVISHGTDTMAYTAAALYKMLSGIKKPVILTGSQLPISYEGTDAIDNLVDSFKTATLDLAGVFIVFGKHIIDGSCATKSDTHNFDAFKSINRPYVGHINVCGNVKLTDEYSSSITTYGILEASFNDEYNEYSLNTSFNDNVALVKLFPGMSPSILKRIAFNPEPLHAVVIEAFGSGGIPNVHRDLLPVISEMINDGIKVYCKTQCFTGSSDMTTYEVGAKALALGVTDLCDMTTEMAIIHAMFI